MKKTTGVIGVIGIIALIGIMVVPALAFGPNWGRGRHMGGNWSKDRAGCPLYDTAVSEGNSGITDEQRSELNALYQKFYDDTAQTRSEIWAKRGEIRAMWNTSNPDEEKLKALQKEISDLRAKMSEAGIEYRLQARKIDPNGSFGLGYGKGDCPLAQGVGPEENQAYSGACPRGFGPGRGPGSGGGYGRGGCCN